MVSYPDTGETGPWTPPAPEARLLQALLSRREPIAQDLRRERNRLEKANAIAHIGVTH